jgi:tetratricopeptide (TPR) repeat protein
MESFGQKLEEIRRLYEQGMNVEAQEKAEALITEAQTHNDKPTEAHALISVGITFLNRGILERALQCFNAAEEILLHHGEPADVLPCLVNTAIVLNQLGRCEDALRYYQRAFEIAGDNETLQHAQLHNGMGNVLNQMKRFEDALEAFRQVERISRLHGSDYGVAMGLRNMAACLVELGQFKDALQVGKSAYSLANQFGYKALLAGAIQSMAEALMGMGEPHQSYALLQQYLNTVTELGEDYHLRYHYHLLYRAAKACNLFESALSHLEQYREVNERMTTSERNKTVNQLHIQYETQKKEVALQKALLLKKETELAAWKSRMNPHFLFNALAGIQRMLHQHLVDEAMRAIENFTHLTREILQQSSMEYVTVQREADMLKSYIELEKMQLDKNFTYHIKGVEDCSFFEIPPLMLQPIIENALLHGLRHKEGQKILNICFELVTDDALKVTIEDNGIGRKQSAALNARRTNHQSFALASIQERIALFREKKSMMIDFNIEDKYKNEAPAGTTVVFNFTYPNL